MHNSNFLMPESAQYILNSSNFFFLIPLFTNSTIYSLDCGTKYLHWRKA